MAEQHRILELEQLSAYALRTHVVGSVLPMCKNKANSGKIEVGVTMLLSEAGPDLKGLVVLGNDGLALRAVSWKTSGSMVIHQDIMRLAGDRDGTGSAVVVVDPTLACLRSSKFLALIRAAMEDQGISALHRSLLVAATLSLVSKTPPHASVPAGIWRETTVNMAQETRRFDSVRISGIPAEEKACLREKIQNTHLLAAIAESDNEANIADMNCTLKANRKGWLDQEERERALALIDSSLLLLVGTRHIAAERDGLLLDPTTCDVSCTHDASRRNVILLGKKVLDVPMEMFTLHLGAVMAAAIRVVAEHSRQDRDVMMQTLSSHAALFEQQTYLVKMTGSKKPSLTATPTKATKDKDKDKELIRLAAELSAFKVQCEARIRVLERRQNSPKRCRTD